MLVVVKLYVFLKLTALATKNSEFDDIYYTANF